MRREIAKESSGLGRRKAPSKANRRSPPSQRGEREASSRLPAFFSPDNVFSPRESLVFLERFLSATLGYMAQRGGKCQGRKQCLEEKATVPR